MGIIISHFQFIASLFYTSKCVIVLRMTILISKYVGGKLQLKLEKGVFTLQISSKYNSTIDLFI